jgi:hypothetical protein
MIHMDVVLNSKFSLMKFLTTIVLVLYEIF